MTERRLFVPTDFVVPLRLDTPLFSLEPLGPEHNDADYAAWSSSIAHIHATPGFENSDWPHEMTLEDNRGDLEGHAKDFAERTGFTYSVLGEGKVVGCVYIYPDRTGGADAGVRSWVSAERAELDAPVWRTVSDWLEAEWPFERFDYAPRSVRNVIE